MVGVAQRIEHRVVAPKAVGSIPTAHPNKIDARHLLIIYSKWRI